MVEMFKRQAKVDATLHLSVSLDSNVMYLERDGALLRAMPITVGPDRRVGTGSDTVHIAAPRGKRLVERLLDESTVSELPTWVYGDRGIPVGETRVVVVTSFNNPPLGIFSYQINFTGTTPVELFEFTVE